MIDTKITFRSFNYKANIVHWCVQKSIIEITMKKIENKCIRFYFERNFINHPYVNKENVWVKTDFSHSRLLHDSSFNMSNKINFIEINCFMSSLRLFILQCMYFLRFNAPTAINHSAINQKSIGTMCLNGQYEIKKKQTLQTGRCR